MVAAAEAAAASLRGPTPTIDAIAIVELKLTVNTLDRWSDNPAWSTLVHSLRSANDYAHTVVTLAGAGFLTDAGNAVEFVPLAAEPGERRPDLRIHIGSRIFVGAEVKAPPALRHRADPLEHAEAVEIVRDALSKAGSGKGGQLDPSDDAFLIIGGFGLREGDMDVLSEAASRVIRGYAEKRQHVMGIGLLSVGVLAESRDLGLGRTEPSLSATLTVRVVENPNYSGRHQIGGSPDSGRLQPL